MDMDHVEHGRCVYMRDLGAFCLQQYCLGYVIEEDPFSS